MAWINKGNGQYYYTSKRVGNRVVSQYVGNGPVAEMIAKLEAVERAKREADRQALQAEIDKQNEIDRAIDEAGDIVRLLTKAVMLSTGHHAPKRTWRRKRNGQTGNG